MTKLKAKFKLWLATKDGKGSLGDGKWQLLKAIEAKGSLAAACKQLKISYRKAWGGLKKLEDALKVNLVEKHRGGNKGGASSLTGEGKQWVKSYTRFRDRIEKAMIKAYDKHIKKLEK